MDTAESIRRRILTFAFVRTNFARSIDPIAALRPFFAPIATDLAEQAFDVAVFRLEMQARYDLHLSRDVTDLFVRRLTDLHYLQATSDARRLVWKRQSVDAAMGDAEESARIDEILAKARALHDQRQDLLQSDFHEDDFLAGLMRLLLASPDIQGAVGAVESAVNNSGPLASNNSARIKDKDQYFASEFVAWAKKNDSKIFDWVADLGGAAMVAEALIEIRTPSPSRSMRADLTVCLDAPFAMELLGPSGRAAQQDAKAIVDGLRSHNVIVTVLRHSVEEMNGNLKAVLGKPPQQRTGPTAQVLIHGEIREQELHEIALDIDYYLKAIGISVVDPNLLTHLVDKKHFSDEDQHNFFAAIQGHYHYMMAAERDAASIAWIIRRRKGEKFRDIMSAKYILLTRNDRLYRTINRFCRDKFLVSKDEVGPVALVRDVAGILWILGGSSERETLSKRQLLLNCQRARGNSPEIVASMYSTLHDVNESSAELFWAAVQKPRYLSLALDAVAGGGGAASATIASDVIDKIREDLVADERAKSRATLQRVREQHAQDTNLNAVAILSLERETSALKEENAKHVDAWKKLSRHLWTIERRAGARSALLTSAVGNMLLAAVVVTAAYVGSDAMTLNPLIEAAIVVVAAVVLLFVSVNRIHVWSVRRAEKKFTLRYEAQLAAQVPDEHVEGVIVRGELLEPTLKKLSGLALSSHSVPPDSALTQPG